MAQSSETNKVTTATITSTSNSTPVQTHIIESAFLPLNRGTGSYGNITILPSKQQSGAVITSSPMGRMHLQQQQQQTQQQILQPAVQYVQSHVQPQYVQPQYVQQPDAYIQPQNVQTEDVIIGSSESTTVIDTDVIASIVSRVCAELQPALHQIQTNQVNIYSELTAIRTSMELTMANIPAKNDGIDPVETYVSAEVSGESPKMKTIHDLEAFEAALCDEEIRKKTLNYWKKVIGTKKGQG